MDIQPNIQKTTTPPMASLMGSDLPQRDPESVHTIQKIVLETQTLGIYRNQEREEYADRFADEALGCITAMTKNGSLPFCILPEYKDRSYKLFHGVVRLHVAAFSKANNDNLCGSLFDLGNTTPKNRVLRESYVAELMSIALENVTICKGKDKQAFKLATYYSSEWLLSWLNEDSIKERLDKKYSREEINTFIDNYPVSERMYTALHKIKDPYEALSVIAGNFLTILSDEGIRTYFKDRLTEEEINTFIDNYFTSKRMRTAVGNIKHPHKALDTIADNYLTVLSDEGIRTYFKDRLTEEEINIFIDKYPASKRVHTAINNIKSPHIALDDIATGKIQIPSSSNGSKIQRFSFVLKTISV